MNKILLIDVDGKNPNIALMKLSTYYKSKGYEVTLKNLNYNYYKNNSNSIIIPEHYNIIFVSIIFENNKNTKIISLSNSKIVYGGSGYDYKIKLPKEIDDCDLDYSLYPDNNISYGFITRGCIRNCYFCIVPKKEGMLYKYNDIDQIIKHKKVKFLDNNFLAYKDHKEILKELIKRKVRFQFNQALDIRLIDNENAELLSNSKYLGEYTFSFDDIKLLPIINEKINILKKYIQSSYKIKFFLYCNDNMPIKDVLDRLDWCKENKVLPYIMRDKNCYSGKYNTFYVDLSAWCNQPNIYKKMTFQQFLEKRHPKNPLRVKYSGNLYYGEK